MPSPNANPYAPPSIASDIARPAPPGDGVVDATRSQRLMGSLLDALISLVILMPIQFATGMYDGFPKVAQPTFVQSLLWGSAGLGLWLAFHGRLAATSAQTIGKRVVGTRIVDARTGENAPFKRIFWSRLIPQHLVALIPYVGSVITLLNVVLVFRNDRRCGHDLIAGTRVIQVKK